MSTDTPPDEGGTRPQGAPDAEHEESTEPTPGSDNDGAEAGYTPPSGSDDPVSD